MIPELSSTADSAQSDYQGKVVEINIESSNRNEFLCDGNSAVESDEDHSWWEEAVKFADSVENGDHGPAFCNLVSSLCHPVSLINWPSLFYYINEKANLLPRFTKCSLCHRLLLLPKLVN